MHWFISGDASNRSYDYIKFFVKIQDQESCQLSLRPGGGGAPKYDLGRDVPLRLEK